LLGKLNVP
jgi:hypothetical protein